MVVGHSNLTSSPDQMVFTFTDPVYFNLSVRMLACVVGEKKVQIGEDEDSSESEEIDLKLIEPE